MSGLKQLNKKLRDGTLFFWGEGGEGMENIEKNCLQGLKRQNKLLPNMICIKKCLHKGQRTL